MATSTQLLIQDRLDDELGRTDVLAWIIRERENGRSYEQVARLIQTLTGVIVTAQTLRNWLNNHQE